MKKIILTILLAAFVSICNANITSAFTSTNTYFAGKEFTVSLAPTFSSPTLTDFSKNMKVGYSLETECWTSVNMGVGVELGSYNVNPNNYIDHTSIVTDYRFIPFSNVKYFNTWAVVLKGLVEQRLDDGSKNLGLGFGVNHDIKIFGKHFRTEYIIEQHFSTLSKDNGFTLKFDIKLFSF